MLMLNVNVRRSHMLEDSVKEVQYLILSNYSDRNVISFSLFSRLFLPLPFIH